MGPQRRTAFVGCNPGAIDGFYGGATSAGIACLQQAWGLTGDGVVGNQTWANGEFAESTH